MVKGFTWRDWQVLRISRLICLSAIQFPIKVECNNCNHRSWSIFIDWFEFNRFLSIYLFYFPEREIRSQTVTPLPEFFPCPLELRPPPWSPWIGANGQPPTWLFELQSPNSLFQGRWSYESHTTQHYSLDCTSRGQIFKVPLRCSPWHRLAYTG